MRTLELSEFNRDRSRPDGVQYCCRNCWAARLEEKKSKLGRVGRRRWEHDNYLRHRARNVRRNWAYFNRRRLTSPDLYVEEIDRDVVYARDKGMCGICGRPIDVSLPVRHGDSFTIDHVKPLRDGGAHSYANVRAAHLRCNVREMHRLARLRLYDQCLVDMAADPLNGAGKDFIVMPRAIRRRLARSGRLQIIGRRDEWRAPNGGKATITSIDLGLSRLG